MAIVFKEGDPMGTDVIVEVEPPSKIFKALQRYKHLLFNDRFSDVTFSVGANKTTAKKIPAHIFLLTQASDVFEAMFSGNWKKDELIPVIDFEAPHFLFPAPLDLLRRAHLSAGHAGRRHENCPEVHGAKRQSVQKLETSGGLALLLPYLSLLRVFGLLRDGTGEHRYSNLLTGWPAVRDDTL